MRHRFDGQNLNIISQKFHSLFSSEKYLFNFEICTCCPLNVGALGTSNTIATEDGISDSLTFSVLLSESEGHTKNFVHDLHYNNCTNVDGL